MSSLLNNRLLSLTTRAIVCIQRRDYSIRQKIHRHKEPDKFKKHMLSACQPFFRPDFRPLQEKCKGTAPKGLEMHPLNVIYIKELTEAIQTSDFALIFQHNYVKFVSERVYKNTIIKSGGTLHTLNNTVYKQTFKNLGLDYVIPLICMIRHGVITGHVDKLPGCINALRKMPQFILIAGLVNGHLYDPIQLKTISENPNVDLCRANLVSTLSTPSMNLSSHLDEYQDMLDRPSEETKAEK